MPSTYDKLLKYGSSRSSSDIMSRVSQLTTHSLTQNMQLWFKELWEKMQINDFESPIIIFNKMTEQHKVYDFYIKIPEDMREIDVFQESINGQEVIDIIL